MMIVRKLKQDEVALITWMIKNTVEGPNIIRELDKISVEEMDDGGMGSLKVVVNGEDRRIYSRDLAKADLWDMDKVPLFLSVNLDTDGNFFELDIFKADNSPLKKFPKVPDNLDNP